MQPEQAADLTGLGSEASVFDEVSEAIRRDVREPGFLRRYLKTEFSRLDGELSAFAGTTGREGLRQFALTVRLCLHAARDGVSLDWSGVVGWHCIADGCTIH